MDLTTLPQLGPKRLQALQSAGLVSLFSILKRLPASYRDLSKLSTFADAPLGQEALFCATLTRPCRVSYFRGRSTVYAHFADDTGALYALYFNQSYMRQNLHSGQKYYLHGRVTSYNGKKSLVCPALIAPDDIGTITPNYRPIEGIPAKIYRKWVEIALEHCPIEDSLPADFCAQYDLMELSAAYRAVHFPENRLQLSRALLRLQMDDLLSYMVALSASRGNRQQKGIVIARERAKIGEFLARLGFPLTGAQKRCIDEILADLAKSTPMARLLQGDVGSGKTAVAQAALFACAAAGYQGAIMAPTEVLARQHYESFSKLFAPLGIRCELLVGSMTQKEHVRVQEIIARGQCDIIIGTHALITDKVEYQNLGLVVCDEQHRFGVNQRTALSQKGEGVNLLVMSATPIPRTLALILYGDLDLSVIDEMPPGRQAVRTHIVPEAKRDGLYEFMAKQVADGRQGYVVCPAIEPGETMPMANTEETFAALSAALPNLRLGMTHSQQKNAEKQEELAKFYRGETDVLVSTTLIEVGVNVPNASFIVVECADRFGLAQLHQLRGRVGRGGGEAYCFLMAENRSKLSILTKTSDGFVIAQKDLAQRGPGELLGTRQSGISDLFALMGDEEGVTMLETAQKVSRQILAQPQRFASFIEKALERAQSAPLLN